MFSTSLSDYPVCPDRMPVMSVANTTMEAVLQSGSTLVARLPLNAQRRLGAMTGWLLRQALSKRWNITIENLRRAFPEQSPHWHQHIARQSFANLGIVLAEVFAMARYPIDTLRHLVRFENTELIAQAAQQQRGIVLLSAHFGNWELAALTLPLTANHSVTVVTKRIKNPIVDRFIDQARQRTGNQLVRAHRVGAIIPKIIRENRALALLADQSARPDHDFYVPFFNIPTLTFRTPAVLALRFGMPVILGFSERQPDGTYRVALEQLPTEDLPATDEGAKMLMQRYHQRLEAVIRRHPEQWLWQHRRWKHSPTPTVSTPAPA